MIDKPDRAEQDFDQYHIPEDPEKNFTNEISIVGHEKMIIFDVFYDFISNFTYLRRRSMTFVFSYDL